MDSQHVRMAFKPEVLTLGVESILVMKQVQACFKKSSKYQRILASVREVGVIEPLIVYPSKPGGSSYFLLDGHLRLAALKDIGSNDAPCLISTDDESFTYNHKVNRLSPIQEHYMILKAIDNGVSEERIAKSLNLNIANIKAKRNLLDGICEEAVEILKDKETRKGTFQVLKKMKPMRQIEAAELMVASNNYTYPYASALMMATPQSELVQHKVCKSKRPSDMLRIEREMVTLEKDFRNIQDTYGRTIVVLTVARGYVQNLLSNEPVADFLDRNYPDILGGLRGVIKASSLEG